MSRQRQPMPVLNALSQPGRFVYLPLTRGGQPHRRQLGQRFLDQLVDDEVRRVWVGAVPDVRALLPEALLRKARREESWTPDTEVGLGQEVIDAFGPQRLPFPRMWIEFAIPHAESETLAPIAAYLMATDYGYGVVFFRLMADGQVRSTILVEQIKVDADGKVTGMQCEWALDDRGSLPNPTDDDEFSMIHITLPVMWAVGLMNCRNVHTVEVTPAPRQTKKQRRPRRAGVSYHTIVLPAARHPGGPAEPTQGTLAEQPLHKVRGHFKTYTAEAPLLGRHTGTYWWGYQIRGAKEQGEVVSDYRLSS